MCDAVPVGAADVLDIRRDGVSTCRWGRHSSPAWLRRERGESRL